MRALNSDGSPEADGGTWWSFTTLPAGPGSFSKSRPTNGAPNVSIFTGLEWEPSSGATSYEFCIDTSDNNTCNTRWQSTGSFNFGKPTNSLEYTTTYYWQVRASNTSGSTEADGGAWWSLTTTDQAPAAFTKTSPANGASGTALDPTLSWTASARTISYAYCYNTTNNGNCLNGGVVDSSHTSVQINGLTAGTIYYWQVFATGTSDQTNADDNQWFSFTTLPVPGTFSKTGPANGAIDQPRAVLAKERGPGEDVLDTVKDFLKKTGLEQAIVMGGYGTLAAHSLHWVTHNRIPTENAFARGEEHRSGL